LICVKSGAAAQAIVRRAPQIRRVGKGALGPCPPFESNVFAEWWARRRTRSRPAALPTLRTTCCEPLPANQTSAVVETSNAVGVISFNERNFTGLTHMRVFYGWWMVAACMLSALVGNALGLFGAGVYLHEVVTVNGWTTGLVSGAVTVFYVVSALLLIPVGAGIKHYGPRPVIALGGLALAGGVIGIGHATAPWQAYLAFLVMGIGWAGLSTTAVATTLAPWFDQHQGRAVSIASLGASVGGIIGAPALLFGIARIGFASTTIVAGLLAIAVVLPLAAFVLRSRPQDLGLFPDGLALRRDAASTGAPDWTLPMALSTPALRSVMATFGIGMMVQIGFLTHQVALLAQSVDRLAVSITVSSTAVAALAGRLALARFADEMDARVTTAAALLVAAGSLGAMGLFPVPSVLIVASIVFGLTVGQVTTLSPIIVRREFGAPAFGLVFGAASCGIQLATALGPGLYGLLYDAFGSYNPALIGAAGLDVAAAAVAIAGRGNPSSELFRG
jgi:MFS family permease